MVPVGGGEELEARPHSLAPLIMLRPGGPPKLGRQVDRTSNGLAEVNVRKARASAIMAEGIVD